MKIRYDGIYVCELFDQMYIHLWIHIIIIISSSILLLLFFIIFAFFICYYYRSPISNAVIFPE